VDVGGIHKNISAFAIIGCATSLYKFDRVVKDGFLDSDIFGAYGT
jgi:hypothetical protein